MASKLENRVSRLEGSNPNTTHIIHGHNWYYGDEGDVYESDKAVQYNSLDEYYTDIESRKAKDGSK